MTSAKHPALARPETGPVAYSPPSSPLKERMPHSTHAPQARESARRESATLPMWVTARQAWELVLGCSKRQFYRLKKEPDFPRGRVLSVRNTRWSVEELEAYMRSKVPAELAQRRADAAAGREVLPAPFSNH